VKEKDLKFDQELYRVCDLVPRCLHINQSQFGFNSLMQAIPDIPKLNSRHLSKCSWLQIAFLVSNQVSARFPILSVSSYLISLF
jgi:hypothetical protein